MLVQGTPDKPVHNSVEQDFTIFIIAGILSYIYFKLKILDYGKERGGGVDLYGCLRHVIFHSTSLLPPARF